MKKWVDPRPVSVPTALREAVGGHPLVSETLVRRGIVSVDAALAFLDPSVAPHANPEEMPGLASAVERLQKAIDIGQQVAIWGDFDVDGQTSTALIFQCLRTQGCRVKYYVPSREQGHGFHPEAIHRLRSDGAGLALTCDTGISAHHAVALAKASGIDVVITDHHVPGSRLPQARAIVNPHFLPEGHRLAGLTGVGVAYQVARALAPDTAEQMLDLVALGTIADVAQLTGENRPLVQKGLTDLRRPKRLGLQAMYEAADLKPDGITEEHLSYVLAPRMNALGRLADASQGVELLVSRDLARVRSIAAEMEGLNAQRQFLTRQITEAVLAQIDKGPELNAHDALVVSHEAWPAGILGVVAGRLAERLAKPVLLLSASASQIARGSGRSVPGIDLVRALAACSNLLTSYGGHPGAAGLSMQADRIPELRAALSRVVREMGRDLQTPALELDSFVQIPDLNMQLVDELARLAPFGRGNPPVVLGLMDVTTLGDTVIGRTGEHRRLVFEDRTGRSQTVFWWQGADQPLPRGRLDLAITVRATDYRGSRELQVELLEVRPLEPELAVVSPSPRIAVHDHRASTSIEMLRNLAEGVELAIWAEVEMPSVRGAGTRRELGRVERLAIWTLPPGPAELREVLSRVRPNEVYLFGADPGTDDPTAFLRRLAGIVKHVLARKRKSVALEELAAATAQRTSGVKAGLEVLAARGQLSVEIASDTEWQIVAASEPVDNEGLSLAYDRLTASLRETAAYRSFAALAPAHSLIWPLVSDQHVGDP